MDGMSKVFRIFKEGIPVLLMIGLIPLVTNDYVLTFLYAVVIAVSLQVKREKNDLLVAACGFFIMIICEYLFVSTGVETFNRTSLFGLMPLWLPLLWAYGFVAIKRAGEILIQ